MIGEEDVLTQRPYSTTITCKSNTGELLSMRSSEFFKKLKPNLDCWKVIVLTAMSKERAIFKRIQSMQRSIAQQGQDVSIMLSNIE